MPYNPNEQQPLNIVSKLVPMTGTINPNSGSGLAASQAISSTPTTPSNLQAKKQKKINNLSAGLSRQTSAKLQVKSVVPSSHNSYKEQPSSVNNVTYSNARDLSGIEGLLEVAIFLFIVISANLFIKYLPAKYSRKQFWIWSVILIIANIPIIILSNVQIGNINESNPLILIFLVLLASLPSVLWIRALANRIRDYGSNPYNALWAVIPLVNMILALYYGSVKSKKKEEVAQDSKGTTNPSLIKAVKNHAQDIAEDAKENLKEYKEEHLSRKHKVAGTTPTSEHLQSIIIKDKIDEDALYEQAMNEIENDTKVKSLWAKAFAHSEGNEEKTKALYIQYRVENLKKIHEETLQKKIREEKEKRTKKVEEKQADEDHAIATLVDNGYKVNKIYGNKWKIKEPLGGKITIDTLEELIEYARSLSYH